MTGRSSQRETTAVETGSPLASLAEAVVWAGVTAVIVLRFLTPTEGAYLAASLELAIIGLGVAAGVAWLWTAIGRRLTPLSWRDLPPLLLVGGHLVAGITSWNSSQALAPVRSGLCEWLASGTLWLLLRELWSPGDRHSDEIRHRILGRLLMSLGLVLAGVGLWQHYIAFPAQVRSYEDLKRRVVEEMGLAVPAVAPTGNPTVAPLDVEAIALVPRSPSLRRAWRELEIPEHPGSRLLWEQRLKSREPLGFFSLANTLAGVLLVVLVVLGHTLVDRFRRRRGSRSHLLLLPLFCVIAFVFLLTKSRTAVVALAVVALLDGFAMWRDTLGVSKRWIRLVLGTLVVLGLILTVAVATGGLDLYVLTEAGKSLRYRAEYWWGTLALLTSSPERFVGGAGLGNFRPHYLAFKLPRSSEEVLDPHNALLDVWANGGLLALVGLCALWWQLRPWGAAVSLPFSTTRDRSEASRISLAVWLGGVVGFVVAVLLFQWDERLIIAGAGFAVLDLLLQRLPLFDIHEDGEGATAQDEVPRDGLVREASPWALGCRWGAWALAIHLLGAGGIGMPALHVLLWLLWCGRGVRSLDDARANAEKVSLVRPRVVVGTRATMLSLVFVLTLRSVWLPVATARDLVARGDELLATQGPVAEAESLFKSATTIDPLATDALHRLVQFETQRAFEGTATDDRRRQAWDRAIAWQREVLRREPASGHGYAHMAELWGARFQQTGDRTHAVPAIEAWERALALYPHQAQWNVGAARLAVALGDHSRAAAWKKRALELDNLNRQAGHRDKLLSPADRQFLESP